MHQILAFVVIVTELIFWRKLNEIDHVRQNSVENLKR